MADGEAEVKLLQDSKKWPLADRVAHASWKIRSSAYDDMKAGLAKVYEETDPYLSECCEWGVDSPDQPSRATAAWTGILISVEHWGTGGPGGRDGQVQVVDRDRRGLPAGPVFGKAVADANAAAQDKALDALLVFLTKATEAHAGRCAARV